MEILIILIPLALLLGGFFIFSFIWSARNGQYDDLETPRFRMLLEENKKILPIAKKLKDDL
jgi:cbb3-type cytochrome oxidase maturation protein